MHRRNHPKDPLWINYFFVVTAVLACLAILWVAIQEWRPHYFPYGEMIADIEVNLNGQPLREHCTTCHPEGGLGTSSMTKSDFGVHPDILPHTIEMLGCTGCHLGEGMALDVNISHGFSTSSGLGAREILKGEDLQASCYACHEIKPLKGAEKAYEGFKIFMELCSPCHYVDSLKSGGRYGPDLSIVGSYLGLKKLHEAIRDPRKEPENSTMPRFPLSSLQAYKISYFLKSRVLAPNHVTPMIIKTGNLDFFEDTPRQMTDKPRNGTWLLENKKCFSCHKINEKDGRIAPDLTFIGQIRTQNYLREFLTNSNLVIPGNMMPTIPFRPSEKKIITEYLVSTTNALPDLKEAAASYMVLCLRCHAAAGDGFGQIQPNLATFPRVFAGNEEFFRRIRDSRIVASVKKGVMGTSMPGYGGLLRNDEQDRLINLIFNAFIKTDRLDKLEPPLLPGKSTPKVSTNKIDKLYKKICYRCHGISGTGRGPESLKYLPRPRNLTNHSYFGSIDENRIAMAIFAGVPGTAMPAHRKILDSAKIWGLAKKIHQLSGQKK